MKTGFYPKLAFDGIRKNRRMYVPFICTCIGMVMMFYIISYLHYSDSVAAMRGGAIVRTMLNLGTITVGIFFMYFSVLHQFLFDPQAQKRIWSVSHFRHGKTKYCPHFVLGDDAYCSNLACDWHWFWHSFFETG